MLSLFRQFCSSKQPQALYELNALGRRCYASAKTKNLNPANRHATKKPRKCVVILTRHIKGIGEKGEELSVSPGYARNFLFPKHYAVVADDLTRQQYAEFTEKIDYEARRRNRELVLQQKRMKKVNLMMKRFADKENVPIAPVTAENICEKMYKQYKIELQPSQIILNEPIKTYGVHKVDVSIRNTTTPIKLTLVTR